MGGREKGLVKINKLPLVSYVLRCLLPHCSAIAISCNKRLDEYQQILESDLASHEMVNIQHNFGISPANERQYRLVTDITLPRADSIGGPVVGIISFLQSMSECEQTLAQTNDSLCIICSADMPLIEPETIGHLIAACRASDATAAHFSANGDYSGNKDFSENKENLKDPFFPMVLNTNAALRAADDWVQSAAERPSKDNSIKNWLASLGGNSVLKVPMTGQEPSEHFLSANDERILTRIERIMAREG